MLDRLVLRYRGRIMSEIRRTMRRAASNISAGRAMAVESVMGEHRERMSQILTRLWTDSGHTMAEHIDPSQKANGPHETKQTIEEAEDFTITPTAIADRIMSDWMRSEGGLKITRITATTRANIQSVIASGLRDGLSEKDIAANIRAIAPGIAGSRADTISRTETHAAANISADATAKATGVPFKRQWAASKGDRTRDAHRRADGQKVGMNEPFNVDHEDLRYPGDPRGRPGNVINCRCAVLYVVD